MALVYLTAPARAIQRHFTLQLLLYCIVEDLQSLRTISTFRTRTPYTRTDSAYGNTRVQKFLAAAVCSAIALQTTISFAYRKIRGHKQLFYINFRIDIAISLSLICSQFLGNILKIA